MKTIEELENENEELKTQLAIEKASANLWWKKCQELENKLKLLKELIQVI